MNSRSRSLILLLVGAVFATAGCATTPIGVETPSGRVPDLFEQLQVLGIASRVTSSLNQSGGGDPFLYEELVEIEVPVGTQVILPAVNGWTMGYGKIDPDTLEGHVNQGTWRPADHHFGFSAVFVQIQDIDAPDMGADPPSQTATLRIVVRLSDDNADDRWFGTVFYGLLFLGRVESPVGVRDFEVLSPE